MCALSSNGRFLLVACDNNLILCNIPKLTKSTVAQNLVKEVRAIAVLNDGSKYYYIMDDKLFLRDNEKDRAIELPSLRPDSTLKISPSQKILAVGTEKPPASLMRFSSDGNIELWIQKVIHAYVYWKVIRV